jgi:diguanylate cyclase (GGDEF)-like protein/PAS domain S-box-containing protein
MHGSKLRIGVLATMQPRVFAAKFLRIYADGYTVTGLHRLEQGIMPRLVMGNLHISVNIKTKLIGLVLLVLVSAFWLSAVINANRIQSDMTQLLSAQQFSVASFIADDIESKVRLRIDVLNASAAGITPELLANLDKARNHLKSNAALQLLFMTGTFVISREGIGIADYPVTPGRQGYVFNELEYFQDVMATGEASVGKPRIGLVTQKPGVAFAVPVRDKAGGTVAVLVGIAPLSDPMLFGQIENATFGKSGYIAIDVPKYGLIATSSDPTRVLDAMAKPGVNLMLDRFVAGYEGSGIAINSKGIETLTSAKRIPSAGWIAQMVLPTKEAFAPVREMRLRTYEISGALSVLAILLAWFLLRLVLRPLDLATSEISNMAAGKAALHVLPVSRNDEIGILLTSFNVLVEQRNKIEHALADSERTLRTIVETEPECVQVLALDGTLVRMNRAGLEMIEADSEAQVLGVKVVDFVVPEYQAAFNALTEKAIQGESGTLEFKIIGLKGGHRWLDTHSVPMRNSVGQVMGILGVTRDVTERRQFQLRAKQFEAIVQSSEDAIIGRTLDGIVTSWNPAAESIFGYTAEEMIGKPMLKLFPSDRQDEEEILLERIWQGDVVAHFETTRVRKDGTTIDISASLSPILDNQGAVIGASKIARYITAHKAAEKELERLAQVDVLTGLANRRHFMALAEQELLRTARYGGQLSVLMMDIDFFKNVNDTYGHRTGDRVIQQLGMLCREALREIDVIGRIGGEEFAVVLPQTGSQSAIDMAERLRETIASAEVSLENGMPLHFTISIGVATLVGTETNLDTLLGYADKFLYAAKHNGRNRVCAKASD